MNQHSSFGQQLQQQIEQYLRHYLKVDYILQYSQLPDQKLYEDIYHTALTEVLEPIQRLVFLPGKRWRPVLTLLHTLLPEEYPEESSKPSLSILAGPLVALVELLHNATLVADDIEDNGKLRRGIPALHLSYGLDRALNACNWVYFLPAALLKPLEQAGYDKLARQLQSLFMQCLSQIHLGQALDIRWHRQHDYVPSTEEYFCMANLKTGALAGLAAEVGILLGQALWPARLYPETPYRKLWQRIGQAFQVLDDLINITVGNPGKLRGDDWLEGKKGLPLCFFVHNAPQPRQRKERQAFVASLLQRVQQSGDQATELELVLDEFISCSSEALVNSVVWLEQELAACRQLAEQLYGPFQQSPCPTELLALLGNLEAQTQRCRNFLGCCLSYSASP